MLLEAHVNPLFRIRVKRALSESEYAFLVLLLGSSKGGLNSFLGAILSYVAVSPFQVRHK